MELLSGGSAADANAMAATVLVEKVMSELAVSADDVAKFVRLQKAMYDSGATPQVRLGFYHSTRWGICSNCLVSLTFFYGFSIKLPVCSASSADFPSV